MKGQVLKIAKHISKYTGEDIYVIFIKTLENGSFKCWVDPQNRNYRFWSQVIARGRGTMLGGLYVKDTKKKLIDADSMVNIIKDDFKSHESSFGNDNIPSGYSDEGDRL